MVTTTNKQIQQQMDTDTMETVTLGTVAMETDHTQLDTANALLISFTNNAFTVNSKEEERLEGKERFESVCKCLALLREYKVYQVSVSFIN